MVNSHKIFLVWNHLLNKNKIWNSHWMVLFQKCVRRFGPSIKKAALRDPMGNSHKNLLLRNHWANCNQTFMEWSLDGLLPNCVRWSRLPTKMATKLKIEKRGMKLKKLLLWNYWANLNQTLLKRSLGGPLSKLCPSVPSCIQDGHHY